MQQLSNFVKIMQGAATTAAGTSEVDGATIDTAGLEGVLFIAKFGTAATDNTLQAQQGADSGLSDAADLIGTSVAVGASDEIVWLDLYRPQERYVRVQVERGTSTTLDWCVALGYCPRVTPVDNTTAGTIAGEAHISPAEGTV
jgi:hypothetical protein